MNVGRTGRDRWPSLSGPTRKYGAARPTSGPPARGLGCGEFGPAGRCRKIAVGELRRVWALWEIMVSAAWPGRRGGAIAVSLPARLAVLGCRRPGAGAGPVAPRYQR